MFAHRIAIYLVLVLSFRRFSAAHDISIVKSIRHCLNQENAIVCLKERALDVINETIMSDKPLNIYGLFDIVKDTNFNPNSTDLEVLPQDVRERSLKLNNLLSEKVEEFIQSRSIKFNLGNMLEGRGKKDKKGGMLMMGGIAMAGMMAQMVMGKIAMMAGAALIMAKIALMISVIIGIKKLGAGGGGGESQHVVYTSSGDSYGHGGGGGGWHRSMNHVDNDAQNIVYRAHAPDTNYNY